MQFRISLAALLGGCFLLASGVPAQPAVEAWLQQAERYLAQPERPTVYDLSQGRGRVPAIGLGQLAESLPPAGQREPLLAALRQRAEAGGPQAVEWRAFRLMVLTLTEPPEGLAKSWEEDLAAMERAQPSAVEDVRHALRRFDRERRTGSWAGDATDFERGLERLLAKPVAATQSEVVKQLGGQPAYDRLKVLLEEQAAQEEADKKRYDEFFKKIRTEPMSLQVYDRFLSEDQARQEELKKTWSKTDQELLGRVTPEIRLHFRPAKPASESADKSVPSLAVPDLLAQVGEARARALLLRAMGEKVELYVWRCAGATADFASKLALAHVELLKVPQFKLVQSLDSGPLYEALDRRFPARPGDDAGMGDYERDRAASHYTAWLIGQGRAAEALQMLQERSPYDINRRLDEEDLRELIRRGHAGTVVDFLFALQERQPAAIEWRFLEELAPVAGRADALLETARRLAARPDLDNRNRVNAESHLIQSMFAQDRVEDGRRALLRLIQEVPKESMHASSLVWAIVRLNEACEALDNKEWMQTGREAAFRLGMIEVTLEGWSGYPSHAFRYLLAAKEFGKVEQLARASLARLAVTPSQSYNRAKADKREFLSLLAAARLGQGDAAGALKVVREDVRWNATDLRQLLDLDLVGPAPGLTVARALQATGDPKGARQIVEAQIRATPGDEAAYKFLHELAGKSALGFVEEVGQLNPEEDRPLVWKARLLLENGRAKEAAQALQRIRKLDSDAVTVQAEIQRALGQSEQAGQSERVLLALQKAKRAETCRSAGLSQRAVQLYREALADHPEPARIHLILARELYRHGRIDESAESFRRAFELMLEGRSRIDFLAYNSFIGEVPERLAEEVFSAAVARESGQAQPHYLLGVLRTQQRRWIEAWNSLRRAVELDPSHAEAWTQLNYVAGYHPAPAAQKDEAALQSLRLDRARSGARLPDSLKDAPRALQYLQETQAAEQRRLSGIPAVLMPLKSDLPTGTPAAVHPYDRLWRLTLLHELQSVLVTP